MVLSCRAERASPGERVAKSPPIRRYHSHYCTDPLHIRNSTGREGVNVEAWKYYFWREFAEL